ncbi:MAG: transglutaminase-like domain-containing protein, partial [Persicimonas sp.]
DEADNFYVRPDYDGVLRLNIKIAAPKSYFGGPIDRRVDWSQFSTRTTPELPRDVATVAAQVLGTLSISREMAPADALDALVEHYRDFEGRELPDGLRGKDLYATLSREQIGVCRHRSLAFLISARALGIPTRYVYNEAHAFVEVLWPSTGWRRIDLGGAADDLSYTGRAGGSTHGGGQDPLPQPPNFAAEMDRMNTQDMSPQDGGQGEAGTDEAGTDEANANADAAHDQAADDASGHEDGANQRDEAADMEQAGQQELGEPQDGEMSEMMDADEASQEPAEQSGEAAEDAREEVIIDVKADAIEVFRGNTLGLHGSVFSRSGRPLGKREIAVYLGRIGGQSDEGLIDLGTLRTDSGGRFKGELSIPDRVSIGRWSVILRFAGDEEYRPARAD